ncbi:HRDC domain-containing protein [Sutcliffiella halmapala]|uniref:HRDC domain-containing protein n=1 Tax=Sutcliffiella halmapala TaxID=79882 RepID=UPI0009954FD0|nr:HRDC domain-containing protein [Sutcliffiella halmapala]
MSFLKNVFKILSDNRDIKEPLVYKEFSQNSTMMDSLKSLAESKDSQVDLKKVEQQLKLFSIGHAGESSVLFELKNSMIPMLILHDVNIEIEDYKAQMDFVLITHKFILVLEVKKLFGNIVVNDKGEFQRVITKNNRVINKEGMYSPINQVERHVAILEKFLKSKNLIEKCPIRYAVTFANPKTIIDISKKTPIHIQSSVIRHDQIKTFLTTELGKNSPVFMLDAPVFKIANVIKENCKEKTFDMNDYGVDGNVIQNNSPSMEYDCSKIVYPDKSDLKYILMDYRSKKAKQQESMPYHIFTNKTLDELLDKKPKTMDDLLEVQGIGAHKAEQYGHDILAIIQKSWNNIQESNKLQNSLSIHSQPAQSSNLQSSLIEYRTKRSKELNVKPYYIFTNNTMEAIVKQKPKTFNDLLKVDGIGEKKVAEFGEDILRIVQKCES